MPFPSTSILETFTDTDGVDLTVHSSNWSILGASLGITDGEIQGNAGTESTGDSANYWNVANFGPDCEVYATISTKPADDRSSYLGLRMKDETASFGGYAVGLNAFAGTDTFGIYRIDNAVATLLGSAVNQEITNGDACGLQARSGTLELFYKATGGNWTSLTIQADSTYPNAGKIAVIWLTNTVRLDDFGGGSIPEMSPYMRRIRMIVAAIDYRRLNSLLVAFFRLPLSLRVST